jgi:hypothetical protein
LVTRNILHELNHCCPSSSAMIKVIVLICAIAASLVQVKGQGTISNPVYVHAYLNGSCELPPNDSPFTATATLWYNRPLPSIYPPPYDPVTNTIVNCSVNLPLSFSPTFAGVHGPANSIQTAPLLFDLGPCKLITNIVTLIVRAWPTESNPIRSTNISLICSNTLTLTPSQMAEFKAGLWYVNVSSSNFPAGEIRGQITDAPVLTLPLRQPTNSFTFNVTGPSGRNYDVYISTNLPHWFTFTNIIPSNTLFRVHDVGAGSDQARFYRVNLQQ